MADQEAEFQRWTAKRKTATECIYCIVIYYDASGMRCEDSSHHIEQSGLA